MNEAHLNRIGGRALPAQGGDTLPMIDPSTGEAFAQIPHSGAADVDDAVRAARSAFDGAWGRTPGVERGRVLARASALVLAHAKELVAIESQDCGKPTAQAKADVLAIARYFEFYAGAADKVGGLTLPYLAGYTVLADREPHGVTGHIIPWNYPLQIFGRSVGAALAAGNACVVKPAEDACLSLLRVADLLAEAGLPAGALSIVCGLGREAGAALAAHAGLDHISFTGSPLTGTAVTQAAAVNHVPVTLELGGKSPQIVFDDADLDAAVPVILNAIVQNAGQTCSAGSRLLVQRGVYEALLVKLRPAFEALSVGPAAGNPGCGPLIRASQLAHVRQMVVRPRPAASRSPRKRASPRTHRPAASTSRPPCCATCRPGTASPRRKSSARCSPPCLSATRPRPSPSPTRPASAWWRGCGHGTVRVRCGSPGA